ncbi:MAG: 4a-hydroxytetrahydrobiopterin dehydratase [Acidobacteriota bacterium]|nr:4a-hydroxytetrahydrobiopterin dehydratase [Acidobacteriota bacterium]
MAGVAWTRRGDHIERTVVRPDFRAAVALVNQVADLAEELDHHPDMTISWTRVALSVTTHDAGGLTALDFELARRVDALVEAVG